MSTAPQYTLRIRDASLNPQGALSAWTAGDLVLRMNDVGNWSLTVKADDPLRQYFTRGNGIIVTRDRGDGSGAQTLMSGPIWVVDRLGMDNYFTLGGPTDDWWLATRNALPLGGRPYMAAALLNAPLRYYRLGEATGTVAADSSGNAQNGTYSAAGVTLGGTSSIAGDPNTAITLNGTTGWVSLPTTGLPTGNSPWTIVGATFMTGNPSALAVILGWGNSATGKNPLLYIDATGHAFISGFGWGDTGGGAALSLSTWHQLVGTWDGTNMICYVDGVQRGATTTPGAMTTPTTGLTAAIGSNGGGTGSFFPGSVDEMEIFAGALSAAQVAALYAAWSATHSAYDTRTGTASSVIQAYVNANLVAATNIDRNLAPLILAADPGAGTTVTGNARWDNLLALCKQLASAGGDIGFKVIQTANGVLTFSCYQPVDRTTNAKFSQDLKNLFDYSYSLAGPVANSVDVLGGGLGAGRTALVMKDATSIANWGIVEGLRDARDTSDVPTMQQRGTADLNAGTEQTNLALTPRDTDAVQYGRDYNLGDIVAITIDGNLLINKIRSVHIQLIAPGDQELITPGIGNPSQGEVAQWFDPEAIARQQAIAKVQSVLTKISTAQ